MSLLRALLIFLGGLLLGVLSIGIFSSLAFPYSEFPLIPILISLALVLRVRPTVFWFLLTTIVMLDLYRTAGFGIGILSFVILIFIGFKITNDIFSHRSLIGCLVISSMTGSLWVILISLLTKISYLIHGMPSDISLMSVLLSAAIQGGTTSVIVGILYAFLPRWWRDRSAMINSGSRL